ncbi:TetR/AcrR family transcriptional regulator [Mycolicibacterium llatzerense]|uniref:TetR/AcrR family transcriptional regulator n=1 Tax=Mycolicibacterium llatzerense TaxID=280871 RepID=UPI00362189AB
MELADSDSWRQVSVDLVCRQARLNKRYFYESYADIDELLAAVVNRVAEGFQAVAAGALDPSLSRPDLARAVLAAVVQYLTHDPRRARLLFGELQVSGSINTYRQHAVDMIIDIVVAKARVIHHESESRDPIARITAIVLLGGTGQAILDWLDGRLDVSSEELVEDLAALWLVAGDGAVERARQRTGSSAARKASGRPRRQRAARATARDVAN